MSLEHLTEADLEPLAFHTLRLSVVKKFCNPLSCWPELEGKPITPAEVDTCLAAGEEALRNTPSWILLATSRRDISLEEARQRHIQKIAYFVKHSALSPICLDVTEGFGYPVEDGNHRLAGAILRGDRTIRAKVAGPADRAQAMGLWNPTAEAEELLRRWLAPPPSRRKPSGPR